MKAMKAPGRCGVYRFPVCSHIQFWIVGIYCLVLGDPKSDTSVLHSRFTHHGSRNLLVLGVALGLQAMKKADAEEAPAMKSMKATKGGQESRDDRHFEICRKRMQVVQLLTMQVTKTISLGSCPHPATVG